MNEHVPPLRSSGRKRPWLRGACALGIAVSLLGGLTTTAAGAAPVSSAVAPLAMAAPDLSGSVVDDFSGSTLDPRWTITNESAAHWSLTKNPGSLTVTAQPGDTWQTNNTAKNVFSVDVPKGDFTAITTVAAPVTKVYQGAGIIAMSDLDNYVRAGLTFVGDLSPSGVAIETDVETAGTFAAVDFENRPGSTGETLRVQRIGNTITTSYWDEATSAWVVANSATVSFDITKLGLYALAAQDGTTFDAIFSDFAFTAAAGADTVPSGPFTLRGTGTASYLTVQSDALALTTTRPSGTTLLTPTPVAGQAGAITLAVGDRPVVLSAGALTLGVPGSPAAVLRITDAGGGKLFLRAADDSAYVGTGTGGALVLGSKDTAARFLLTEIGQADAGTLTINGDETAIEMSQDLYGIFYEDINYAADGGLYAELVRNRSFEFNSSDNGSFTGLTAWETLRRGTGSTTTATVGTGAGLLNTNNRFFLTLNASAAGDGIRNIGYNNGVVVETGAKYDFSIWARSTTAQNLTVRLENAGNTATFGTGTVAVDGSNTWKKYSVTLTGTGTTDAARLAVLAGAPSTVALDQVSLFPQDTWVGPVNGASPFRKDLAEHIEALEPKFLRFPGGCVTNVGTFKTYEESGFTDRRRTYQWKETIGPVEERPANWNFWGYNQSYGIGYLEYFEFAEDLGAIPLPVLSVGANGCGSTIPEMTDEALIARWVDDTVDLIEFATGDVTTEWGGKRAALGHPEPFEMKWIGLGNEENTTTFEANFPKFRDAIAARYPDIEIISNSGPDSSGARFDTLWAFNRAQDVDLVDEHYYRDPSWFLANNTRYDSYDREGPKVFLGEYASRGNTLWNALSEASYMTALERNSDVVELASYAPLLSNESHVQWSPDAIWFDNDESWLTPNYWVQQMFSANQGDQLVPSAYTGPTIVEEPIDGGVFLSTWNTAARYDNLSVTSNDNGSVLFSDTFTNASQWQSQAGTWAVANGQYAQTATNVTDARTIITDAYGKDWSNYTLELDATKTAGSEGFLIGFGAGAANDYFWWNLGGWNNSRSVLQKASGGSANEVKALEGKSVVTGQTYRVKIEVQGRTIKLYLDGALQMEYTDTQVTEAVFQNVTRDVETGDIVVKVVNTSDEVRPTTIATSRVSLAPTGTATVLSGLPTDTNSKANPNALVPVEFPLTDVSNDFTYAFEPYSVTFLRLHLAEETADTTAPVLTVVTAPAAPNGLAGWYNSAVSVTATATDDVDATPVVEADTGSGWAAVTGPLQLTDGTHSVQLRATDASGNVSAVQTVSVKVDATVPTVSGAVAARAVTVTAADTGSGIDKIEYRIGTGAWTAYTAPVAAPSAAAATVEFRATDKAGNTSVVGSAQIPAGTSTPQAEITTATACLGGKAVLTVRVRSTSTAAQTITVTTPLGTKTWASVAPKGLVANNFAATGASLTAGTVTIASGDGSSTTLQYAARSCG